MGKQSVVLLLIFLVILMTGCGLVAENWELANIISNNQTTDTVTEIVEVRFCTSTAEIKTVNCSAGTSNDLTLGAIVEGGASIGNELIQGNLSIGAEVASTLGFNRNSGESLILESPPTQGYVYLYPVNRNYSTFSGRVQAVSSIGNEAIVEYIYNASCSIQLGEKEVKTCDGAIVSNAPINPPEVPTPTNPLTSNPTAVVIPSELEAPTPTNSLTSSPSAIVIPSETVVYPSPIQEHQLVSIGTGVFEQATFSDGLAPYSESWLRNNNHFNTQRIRREEQPTGCDISEYAVNQIWVGAYPSNYNSKWR